MDKLVWTTEKRRVKDLIPFEYNPRRLSKKRKKKLIESLEKFNLAEIPAVNSDNKIIAGHQRIMILMELERGDELIDVRVPNRPLTDDEFREYNIRSNVEYGEWDLELLEEYFDDLDLDEFGLDIDELTALDVAPEFREEKEGEFDDTPPVHPVSKPGDVFSFISKNKKISHRLMCGNSANADDVEKLMSGDKAHLVFTDPPYNVNYKSRSGHSYSSKKYGSVEGKIFNDNKTDNEAVNFYTDVLTNLYDFTRDDTPIYWWYALNNYMLSYRGFKNAGWHISQTIIWLKENIIFSPGADFHRTFEPCMFGWKKGKKHYKNKTINNLKDIIALDFNDYKNAVDIWYERRDKINTYVHPTQKPTALCERALDKHSRKNFVVLDLFSGSGSTLIACEKKSRQARVMELDPKYVDVSFRRIVGYFRYNNLPFSVTRNGKEMSLEEINEIMHNVDVE